MRISARKLHKYLGIPLCVLLFFASLSGILLNHRELLRQIEVPRRWLPESYGYHRWNHGALRGGLSSAQGIYLYGNAGVWQVDTSAHDKPITPALQGFASGADERQVLTMSTDSHGRLWALTPFRLYQRPRSGEQWREVTLPSGLKGRLADLLIQGDSLLLLSRSQLYCRALGIDAAWREIRLPAPQGYTGELLLFRLVWALHSGEYFGLAGRLVVDLIGVLCLLLSLTGLGYTLLAWSLRRRKHPLRTGLARHRHRIASALSLQDRWHRRLGRWGFWALVFVTLTGWMLRPPLMLPLLFAKARPFSGTALASSNPWFDRLRALRYDTAGRQWLLATSEGFFTIPRLGETPQRWTCQPPVSPMGVTVLEQEDDHTWLIGSLSGLYRIYPSASLPLEDYFTGERYREIKHIRPVTPSAVAGLLPHSMSQGAERVVRYEAGITDRHPHWLQQPEALQEAPYSLWGLALEWHTGRIYHPLLGGLGVDLFIFFFGLATCAVLWSGRRRL